MHPHHGHHGHRSFHGMNLPSNRARRGDVRAAIVALLKEQDMHGYQMIQEISERTNGAWSPSPGAVYPALQTLEDQGMIASDNVEGKRVFSLSEIGRKHAEMLPAEGPWAEMADESDPARALRESFQALVSAVAQISRAGATEQIEKTTGILNDARKRIYTLLAGE